MKKIRILWPLLSAIVILLVSAGISYAWFAQNASMTTLMQILPPDTITIIPISEATGSEMTELDLDFHENSHDFKDEENGRIHILRPICIKSTSPIHRLEVVHTTNLKNLTFNIFPAVKEGSVFSYDRNAPIAGGYKNQNFGTGLAKEETLVNYNATTEVADIHAYPLYWLAVNSAIKSECKEGWQEVTSYITKEWDSTAKEDKEFYNTYYYLEISWLESTKETDLFYIMAQNVAE